MDYSILREMVGKTFSFVKNFDNDSLMFLDSSGNGFKFYPDYDGGALIEIDDIVGDLEDLIGSPIIEAEEVWDNKELPAREIEDESYTWTFYKFATIKGYVTVKWYGTSNGCYSESVSLRTV